jgi:hypothetical protein
VGATATLAIKILGDARSAATALDSTAGKASTLSSKMQSAGRVAGKVLAVGLLAAGAAAVSATKAAADDDLAQTKLAQTYRNAADATKKQIGATEAWITAQGKSKAFSDDELRPALSKMVVATGSVEKAQRKVALAMNISAGTGKSLETVTSALQKAQNGSLGGLSRLGVATTDAAGNALTLKQVTQSLADTYKGAAATAADTAAGKQKILTIQMSELQEQIGTRLLPVMLRLTTVGLGMVEWVSHNTTLVGILAGTLGGLLGVTWAVGKAITVWSNITKIATGVQTVFNAVMSANPVAIVVLSVIAISVALVIAYKKSETFRRIVDATFAAAQKAIRVTIGWLGVATGWLRDKLPSGARVMGRVVVGAFKIATAPARGLIGVISDIVGWVSHNLPSAFSTMSSRARSAIDAVMDKIRAIIDAGRNVAGFVTGSLIGAFQRFRDGAKAAIDAVVGPIKSLIGWVEDLIDKISQIHIPDIPSLPGLGNPFGRFAAPTVEAVPVKTVVINVTGAIDPVSTARQIRDLLNREASWSGRLVVA